MIRRLIAKFLYCLYWVKIMKDLKSEKKRIIPIYSHNTEADTLEQLIKWFLSKGFCFISSTEMIFQVKNGIKCSKQVWLTFDDGYEKNYTDLLPILLKYNVPATFFIAAKAVEDGYFWYQKAFQNRYSKLYKEVQELWEMPNSERVKIIDMLPPYKGKRSAISPEHLRKLGDIDQFIVANHTNDHVICDHCTNAELMAQINLCENYLKCICSNYLPYFSYPNGNYDSRVKDIIVGLGFEMACTTKLGFITEKIDLFDIPRNEVKDYASLEESILSAFNYWTPFFNRCKKILHIVNKK